jgi:hypothetical protein
MIGGSLGGAVALLAAVRLELPLAALLCPVTRGDRYLDELHRRHIITGFMRPAERTARREPLARQLDRGPVALHGVRLTRTGFDGVAEIDLGRVAERFAGCALVAGVSRTGRSDKALRELGLSFRSSARPTTIRILEDPLHVPFGELHVRKIGRHVRDVRIDLDRKLSRLTVDWAASQSEEAP